MIEKDFYKGIERCAAENPKQALLTIEDDSVTYEEFIVHTKQLATSLYQHGVRENTKVGLLLCNSIKWYELFFAAVYLGAQPVPIDPQSGIIELTHLLEYTKPKVLFLVKQYRNNPILNVVGSLKDSIKEETLFVQIDCLEGEKESFVISMEEFLACEPLPIEKYYADVKEGRVMSLACTSGSTGNPKILTVPYEGFYEAIYDMGQYLKFTNKDVMMIGMPLYHQGGFGMGLQMVVNGGHVIYQPKFEPTKFLETVQREKVTVIQLTSTLAKILLSHPQFEEYDLSSVRICYFAGEVLPAEIAKQFVEQLGIRVVNIIGSSETATMVVWDSDYDYDVDPSDFRELPFTKAELVDENGHEALVGELKIYTTAIIYNYFKNEEATRKTVVVEDGVRKFLTGDLAKRLPDGRIRFLGRSKRIIKRGANLVHAEEVEAALLMHPRIQAVAIVAKKHPVIGEQILAYIQTTDGEKITRSEIAKYFYGRLSAYKLPDLVITTEEVPHDIGKVQFKYITK